MAHEDVPGYTEIREELFQARLEERLAKTDEERERCANRVTLLRRKLAACVMEYEKEKQNIEVKKGK